jgi:hypothetical protein
MSTPDKDRVNRLVLELLAENPDDAAVASVHPVMPAVAKIAGVVVG